MKQRSIILTFLSLKGYVRSKTLVLENKSAHFKTLGVKSKIIFDPSRQNDAPGKEIVNKNNKSNRTATIL
ncbi:hypothetical protein LF887_17340 [Chryseobacterium sp. MEBOG06]|uniref:hypothetical protein n=1 Tax=Chryseobacterium sp. MEBOG06 TaxID=2879938 RepID=UPI001F3CF3F0|nr:hypothetical protein [Chryseobacterium sp. MEBOG06]UKB82766.1 hypothetical protein LF887_17340 [Chryseobacterium sp. MEBOG06]